MIKSTYYCDVCKNEFQNYEDLQSLYFTIERKKYYTPAMYPVGDLPTDYELPDYKKIVDLVRNRCWISGDICLECKNKLKKIVYEFMGRKS